MKYTYDELELKLSDALQREDVLEAQVKQLAAQLELSEAAERAWETTMMRVCGEDGVGSVAEKFRQLAAENVALKSVIEAVRGVAAHSDGISGWHLNGDVAQWEEILPEIDDVETPATDAAIAALRAEARKEGAIFAANRMLAAWDAGFVEDTPENAADIARAILSMTEFMDDAPEGDFDRSFADEMLKAISAQLRSQSAASPAIVPLPVERDQYGYWTHPAYDEFCDEREHIPSDEFNAWMKSNGLEWTVVYRDEEEIDPAVDGYDISKWRPEAPAGNGWFVGSIHDTEDGAVCIWLRNKSEPSPEAAAIARQSEQVKGEDK